MKRTLEESFLTQEDIDRLLLSVTIVTGMINGKEFMVCSM